MSNWAGRASTAIIPQTRPTHLLIVILILLRVKLLSLSLSLPLSFSFSLFLFYFHFLSLFLAAPSFALFALAHAPKDPAARLAQQVLHALDHARIVLAVQAPLVSPLLPVSVLPESAEGDARAVWCGMGG